MLVNSVTKHEGILELNFSTFLIAVVRFYGLKPSSVQTRGRNKHLSGVRDRTVSHGACPRFLYHILLVEATLGTTEHIMSRTKKILPIAQPLRSVVCRREAPCSDEIRSIRADVQLVLEIDKRTKFLETTRPRTASVTPTLNLVLARARDTVQTLTAQLQNNTGENIQIRMYAVSISHSLAFDGSSTLQALCHYRSDSKRPGKGNWGLRRKGEAQTPTTGHCFVDPQTPPTVRANHHPGEANPFASHPSAP